MADVINLRMARKAKLRGDAAREAETRRAAHGRARTERDRTVLELARAAQRLDQHRRDDTP